MIALSTLDQFKEEYVQLNLDEDTSGFGQMERMSVKTSSNVHGVNVFSLNEDIIAGYKAELIDTLGFGI
jgi:hypothetical protein